MALRRMAELRMAEAETLRCPTISTAVFASFNPSKLVRPAQARPFERVSNLGILVTVRRYLVNLTARQIGGNVAQERSHGRNAATIGAELAAFLHQVVPRPVVPPTLHQRRHVAEGKP